MYVVYKDARGEFRWRLVDMNGKIVGDSGEGYLTRDGAHRAIANVRSLAPVAPIRDQ